MPSWTKEQEKAIFESGKNIIVSAGAGSGKTAVLTERVIEKLKQGIKINELLVLTFTNAAALEMKERIRSKIQNYPELQDNLDFLESAYITTYDAYTLSLIKKYNYKLNVSKNLKIIDNSVISLIKEDILEKVFTNLYDSENVSFQNFLKAYTTKNDTQFKKNMFKIIDKFSLISDLDSYMDNYLNTYLSKEKIQKYLEEFTELIKEEVEDIKTNIMLIDDNSYGDYASVLESNLENLLKANSYEEFVKSININLPRRPSNSEEIKEYKDNIDNALKKIKSYLIYQDEEEIIKSLENMKEDISLILSIVKEFNNCLDNYKLNNDVFEFGDISKMAIKLLKENEDIRLEVKNSFKEICIDEYQDTNDLQEDFIKLIENNNVYMVGDIKQSIYGFRNANPYIFKTKYDLYAKNEGGIKIDLLKNFRSNKDTIAGINTIFNLIMDDFIGGANYRKEHQMNYGNLVYDTPLNSNGKLELLNYQLEDDNFKNNEVEAFIIANDIKDKIAHKYEVIDKKSGLKRPVTYSDFCLIMDRGRDFSLYKKIFEYLKIPLTIYEDKTLTNEIDIKIIHNILGLILKINENNFDKEFTYYFMSVGRSFLFSYSDDYLFKIIKNDDYKNTDLYQKSEKISLMLNDINNKTILNNILEEFDYYENLIKVGNVNDAIMRIDNLLSMGESLSSLGYTPNDFWQMLKNTLNNDVKIKYKDILTQEDSVKIMNIHKSKGLEFSICYYSGFKNKFNVDDLKDMILFDKNYGLILPNKEDLSNTILYHLYKNNYLLQNVSEQIRLLYVALTRSKEKIIIVLPLEDQVVYNTNLVNYTIRKKYNSFLSIFNSLKNDLKDYIKNVKLDNYNITKNYLFENPSKREEDIPKEEKIIYQEIEIENEEITKKIASKKEVKIRTKEDLNILERGREIHKILEMTDFRNVSKDNPLYYKIKNLVKYFDISEDAKIYKEYEFSYEENKIRYHGIIDLIIEEKDNVKIIDYKLSNINDSAYVEQLKTYYNYLKTITNKRISLYLYSIKEEQGEEVNL